MQDLILLPNPRHVTIDGGAYALPDQKLILIQCQRPQQALFATRRLQDALRQQSITWEAIASTATPLQQVALTIRIEPELVPQPQGYNLRITPSGMAAEAHDEAGLFYAICTLVQIVQQYPGHLPCLTIADWPDFPARGVMLDISRDKVPTMETLYALVDMLAGWKINQLQLYTEHTFAYRNHPEAWALASPMTGQQIMELDAYCHQRYVELVPNQNSFGHMERWLIHPRYAALSEGAEPNMTLCPTDPAGLAFVASLFDELLPHFSSHLFNVGCDETQVGQGRSKHECEQRGVGRVYLDFLLGIYNEVKARDHTMQFWGDIIMHYPELIPELPKDIIALEWGYDADHPFAEHAARFAASGIPFYVCPGTSSWQSIAGRTDNALANVLNAAENGLKNGAIGYLNTDWGDRGHWQVLPVSFLPLAAGAAYSWCVASNRVLDVPVTASRYAFADPTGIMGRIAFDLGNVYKAVAHDRRGAYTLFRILQTPLDDIAQVYPTLTATDLQEAINLTDDAIAQLDAAQMQRPDAELIKDEFALTARLLRHACRRGILALSSGLSATNGLRRELDLDMLGIIQDYCRIWLARNRQGGLADSAHRLEKARLDYRWYPFDTYPC